MNHNRSFFLALIILAIPCPSRSQSKLVDDFETLAAWKAVSSEGAKLTISSGEGLAGKALVMEFDLTGAYGYTIARRDISLDLPPNYQFTFDMRAEAPVNNFEFKIVDSLENVWWIKKLNVTYPVEWSKQRIKKRHLTFAWGPSGGGEIHHVKAVEFVVSSGSGGKGKVFIDNFRFVPVDDGAAAQAKTSVRVSSAGQGYEGVLDSTGGVLTNWRGSGKNRSEWVQMDFGYQKEIGGLVIDWERGRAGTAYEIQISEEGTEWETAYRASHSNGGRDYVYLPEQQTRFLRVLCTHAEGEEGYGMARLEVKGPEFGDSANNFFTAVATDQRRGLFPRYFLQEQCFWTVIGSPRDTKEALINENGTIEVDQLSFSMEPFLFEENTLVTWNDVTTTQSLEDGYLPIPSVGWEKTGTRFSVRAFSAGAADSSILCVTYRVENTRTTAVNGKLFVALRPFQVNPPWQWLNHVGGVSRIDSILAEGNAVHVDDKVVVSLSPTSAVGASAFENGDITEYLAEGRVPQNRHMRDRQGFGSGVIVYDYHLESGGSKEIHLAIPFHPQSLRPPVMNDESVAVEYIARAHAVTRQVWESKLGHFQITLPASAQPMVNTLRSTLAYIFINQDGSSIQPGSRSYERSWMRDGSLTSTAMLQLGIRDEVRDYIDWYAQYQFPSGKIPCVVDTRGGDPTNEHDSHGQFIYLVMQYFRYSRDTLWLRGKWDQVVKTVRYVQGLRGERKTDVYKNGTPEQRACYGLVPESISHEGYWAKPMHSYWDNFFILRGLKDAAAMAAILGERELEKEFSAERDDLRKDLYSSMRLTMETHGIGYIPGCAELGDFDATSTTIGVNPANEVGYIPEPQLHNTFDRYYDFFRDRRDGRMEWTAYTPYENRVIGTFVYLGQKERAHEAVDFFMKDRLPAGWNHWAEVVHFNRRAPKYIGDMPHTWVGSDFIRSIRAMFVYERERDNALVIGAGIPEGWLAGEGVSARSLSTYYGHVNFSMKLVAQKVTVEIAGELEVPAGKVILRSPLDAPIRSVMVNGEDYREFTSEEVTLTGVPVTVELLY